MSDAALDQLRYPIGQFAYRGPQTAEQRRSCIGRIEAAAGQLRRAVEGLTEAQLDTPYRAGGWTVRQLLVGPALAFVGVLLTAAASVAQRARDTAVAPAPAWIPGVMMLVGIAALIIGVLSLLKYLAVF